MRGSGSGGLWAWARSSSVESVLLQMKETKQYQSIGLSVLVTEIFHTDPYPQLCQLQPSTKTLPCFTHVYTFDMRIKEIEKDKRRRERFYLQMAFNFIIGQTVNFHQLSDLLWGGHCFHYHNKKEKSIIATMMIR